MLFVESMKLSESALRNGYEKDPGTAISSETPLNFFLLFPPSVFPRNKMPQFEVSCIPTSTGLKSIIQFDIYTNNWSI